MYGAEISAHMCDVGEEATIMNGFLGRVTMLDRDARRMDTQRKPDGTPPELPRRADLLVYEVRYMGGREVQLGGQAWGRPVPRVAAVFRGTGREGGEGGCVVLNSVLPRVQTRGRPTPFHPNATHWSSHRCGTHRLPQRGFVEQPTERALCGGWFKAGVAV